MSLRPRFIVPLLLWALPASAQDLPGLEPEPQPEPEARIDIPRVEAAIVEGVEAALAGERRIASKRFEEALILAPEITQIEAAYGAAALLLGDVSKAKRILKRRPGRSLYLAMAEAQSGKGGLGRARTELSRETKLPDDKAEPGALFLAALAFYDVDQKERADKLLDRAARLSKSALDDAFSPDPAHGMVKAALGALEVLDGSAKGAELLPSDRGRIRMATALFSAERRGEAKRLALESIERPQTRAAGLRILVLTENAVQAQTALSRVEAILARERDAEDARVARIVLLLRSGRVDEARRALDSLGPIDSPDLRSELNRAKAEILLNDPARLQDAVEAAQAALRDNPKSNPAVAVYIRALLKAKKLPRAKEFLDALYERRPNDVDPFALYAELHAAYKNGNKVKSMRVRSEGFQNALGKLEDAVKRREVVIKAVRTAEAGLGAAGLESMVGEHPGLSLPLDLALARLAKPGSKRAARDRILIACTPLLRKFLTHKESWEFVEVDVGLYGQVQRLRAPLSGAEPGRCAKKKAVRRDPRRR